LALKNEIPPYYMAQCQKQMFVSGKDCMAYVSYRSDEDYVEILVVRDDAFIEKMIEAEKAFYKCLIDFTPPPATDKDYVVKDDEDWNKITFQWKFAKETLKEWEEREKTLRDQLIDMCDGQSSMGAGVKISKCIKKGNIDYGSIEILKDVNLDAYRKPVSNFWRISNG